MSGLGAVYTERNFKVNANGRPQTDGMSMISKRQSHLIMISIIIGIDPIKIASVLAFSVSINDPLTIRKFFLLTFPLAFSALASGLKSYNLYNKRIRY